MVSISVTKMALATSDRKAAIARPNAPTGSPSESEAARRELVRRIVRSPSFAKSERLGTLLTYVCNMAFEGRTSEINEQKIGEEVFGRSPDYDSAVDGIVRSQASRLRQRLDLYFQQDGANEPVRVTIPRGGYVPVFEAQSPPSPAIVEPIQSILDSPSPNLARFEKANAPGLFVLQWMPWGLSLLLAISFAALWVHDRRTHAPPAAATHPFWSGIFKKGQATLVVAPDSGLVLYSNMSGQTVDLKRYLDAGYRSELHGPPQADPTTSRSDWLAILANRRYTSIVDLKAILALGDRARSLGSQLSVRYARDLRPDDFKTGNVVLLGSSIADPWVELYERNMNFILKDGPVRSSSVLNRSPNKGEPASWSLGNRDPERRVFGLIAYLPSLAGNGNALILQGMTMSGTEAAMDFVNDDTRLLPFLARIRRPDGSLPHFEILLATNNTGSSSVQSEIIAWRTIK